MPLHATTPHVHPHTSAFDEARLRRLVRMGPDVPTWPAPVPKTGDDAEGGDVEGEGGEGEQPGSIGLSEPREYISMEETERAFKVFRRLNGLIPVVDVPISLSDTASVGSG